MKSTTIKFILITTFILFIQSCGIFKCPSQNPKIVPIKSYYEIFGNDSYRKYYTVSKSFLTPRMQEICTRDFMREIPAAVFKYTETRWDPQRKCYFYFFNFCFRNEVCYAYDAEKDKLLFKVFISPLVLDETFEDITIEDLESDDEKSYNNKQIK